jgi:hypothetical protein
MSKAVCSVATSVCRLVLIVVLGMAAMSVPAQARFDCNPNLCNQCFNGLCCDPDTLACIDGPSFCGNACNSGN